MSEDDITDIDFPGDGPFAMPLLSHVVQVEFAKGKEFVVALCAFQDGALVHIPMTIRCVEELLLAATTLREELGPASKPN